MVTKPPAPFDLPRFSFRAGAVAGNVPLLATFQPLVKSGVGMFYWDFEGIGKWQRSSKGPVAWEFTAPGYYRPVAMADFGGGDEVRSAGEAVLVEDRKPKVLGLSGQLQDADCYSTWSEACRIHEGDRFLHRTAGIAIYRFSCHATRDYEIILDAVGQVEPGGMRIEVQSASGKVIARSGGNGKYGWLRLQLSDHNDYQLWVIGSGGYSLQLRGA